MQPVLFTIGPLIISPFGFFAALAFILGSYFLWKKLREDYPEEEILTLTIFLGAGAIFGARIFYYLSHWYLVGFSVWKIFDFFGFPGYSFFGAVLGALLVLIFYSKKKNWDPWVTLDEFVKIFFLSSSLIGFGSFLSSGEIFGFAFTLLSIICFLIFLYLSFNYRRFVWYKSGKPGFAGLTSFAIFVFIYLVLALFLKSGIFWEEAGFLVLALYALGIVYYRSGRNLKDDLKIINKNE